MSIYLDFLYTTQNGLVCDITDKELSFTSRIWLELSKEKNVYFPFFNLRNADLKAIGQHYLIASFFQKKY